MTRLNMSMADAGLCNTRTLTSIRPMLLPGRRGYYPGRDSSRTVGDITVRSHAHQNVYAVNVLLNIQVDVIRSLALFSRLFGILISNLK